MARENKVSTLVSRYVLDEIERIIEEKLPKLEYSLDAPILASAMQEKVDYLITLDRKDFIDDSQVSEKSKLTILTPGTFVKLFRKNHAKNKVEWQAT